jgi:hypothetical protein
MSVYYAHRIEGHVLSDSPEGVEYDGNAFALRLRDIRMYNGAARVYFDESGDQVVRGTQFAPIADMDRRPFNIRRPWETYQITTNLAFDKPVPNGYKIEIEPYEAVGDIGFMFLTRSLPAGFTGPVQIVVVATRRAMLDEGIIFARASLVADWEQPPALHEKEEVKEQVKVKSKAKTTNPKKKATSEPNEVETPPEQEASDADSTSE